MEKTSFVKTGRRKLGKLSTRRSGGEFVVFLIVFLIFVLYSASLILPFLWMIMNSFKDGTEYAIDVVNANTLRLPTKWLFSNYTEVFSHIKYNDITFFGMMLNSFYYIVVGEGLRIFFVAVTSYVIAKYTFKGRGVIYAIAIFAMTLPIIGNSAAGISLRASLGLYDNLLAVIFTAGSGAWGFEFLLMYAFFKSISWEYAEAGLIDGANHYTIFFRIMLPMGVPMLTTLFILSAITSWNDYTTPMLYFTSYPNLAMGLYQASNELTRGEMSMYYAALVITTLPVLLLFSLFSGKIMKNYSIGGLKG
mgnify:FL=1